MLASIMRADFMLNTASIVKGMYNRVVLSKMICWKNSEMLTSQESSRNLFILLDYHSPPHILASQVLVEFRAEHVFIKDSKTLRLSDT